MISASHQRAGPGRGVFTKKKDKKKGGDMRGKEKREGRDLAERVEGELGEIDGLKSLKGGREGDECRGSRGEGEGDTGEERR